MPEYALGFDSHTLTRHSEKSVAYYENPTQLEYDEHLAAAEKFGYKVKFVLAIMGGGILRPCLLDG